MLKKALGLVLATPLALGLAMPLALGLATPATAQDVEEVLTNHYEAIGGLEAWKSLESVKFSGKMVMGMGMEAPFTMVALRPNKARMEFTIQGMTGIQATDGEIAWMIMPFMGATEAEEMPEEQAKAFKREADIDGPLIDYEESGHQVELLGTEEVEGTETYKVKLTYEDGAVRYYYLDAEYYLPVKIEETREIGGNTVTIEQSLGDYKEVGGLLMAHTIEVKSAAAPGGSQVLTVDTVELGVEVEDSAFSMPEGEGSN